MKLALALIVKGTPQEAKLLDRLLEQLEPVVDAIFITGTYIALPEEAKAVEAVTNKHGGFYSDFKWQQDFAAARNFNFAQVPKLYDYIMWSDADDMWRGFTKLRETIEKNTSVDAFGFWYLYDWDESKKPIVVHKKTMIVRNDGTFNWEGSLHEDLMANRMVSTSLVEGIERLHLSSPERYAANKIRNVEVAKAEVKRNADDPRSFWNLANSLYGVANYPEAQKAFETFLEESQSDEEKYLAHVRLADVYKAMGQENQAVKELQYAIGLEPLIPDAYLQLSYLYFSVGNYDKAEKYCLDGIQLKPLINRMIVYNPRDYDYNPMMLLAQIYYNKNRPDLMLPMLQGCLKIYPDDEKLKRLVKEGTDAMEGMEKAMVEVEKLKLLKSNEELAEAIDSLPLDIRSHPAVCVLRNTRLIKKTSSGKDLVIYCGETQHQWNPKTFETEGIGGSEEAVIHMAREFARLGWNVSVFNNCGHKRVIETVYDNHHSGGSGGGRWQGKVTYYPFWEWNYRDKVDVTILWRRMKPLDVEINSTKIYADVHDVIPPGEFTEKRLQRLTGIFVKSKFHRSLFPNVPDSKMFVVPNGFETYFDSKIKKDPMLIINTSSPDRSLDVLPKLFKEIKKQVPAARLQWAYGWEIYKSSFASDQKKLEWMAQTIKEMEEAGIEVLGRLPQHEVGKLYQKAAVLAYPTEFAEIDCISVKKAQAAGCVPVTTDFGALAETVQNGSKIHSTKTKDTWNRPYQFHFGLEDEKAQAEWVEAVVKLLQNPDLQRLIGEKGKEWGKLFTWSETANKWNKIISK